MYWDITDTLQFTGGVRHNRDTKGSREREVLLASSGSTTTPFVPLGTPSVRDILDPNEAVQGNMDALLPATDFRVIEGDFNATTGRAVLQWTPNANAQFYASYTRGYKPGGFNPRTGFAQISDTFDPETINAIEAGVKSNLFDGVLQANLTGFYYDYSGLQISRIVANTSVNDNINATVWGLESEFVLRPDDHWTFNLNASYLNTDVGEFATVDVRNPTQFDPGLDLIADLTNGGNCVIDNGGAPSLIGQSLPGPLAAVNPLIASNFSVCSQLASTLPLVNGALGTNYQLLPNGGVEVDVTGNELPGSPEFQISGGVQYEARFGDFLVTPRVDAYYQSDMFVNVFNTVADEIDGYAYLNGQIRFEPAEGNWYLRAFVQNITDEAAITGAFPAGQGAGNFTNLFLLEPRRWGFGVGLRF